MAAIYVAPSKWGLGAGQQLMSAVVDLLREAGYSEARLWVFETNYRARRFYTATGWRLDDSLKDYGVAGKIYPAVRYSHSLT